jgi:hypothetical protein
MGWAIRQERRHRPFLEFAGGSTIAPIDLLLERAPLSVGSGNGIDIPQAPLAWRTEGLFRARRPGAWAHVLNLIAVSAEHGDEPIDALLAQLQDIDVKAEGMGGASAGV